MFGLKIAMKCLRNVKKRQTWTNMALCSIKNLTIKVYAGAMV